MFGQLGDGTTSDKLIPTQISSATNWLEVAGGNENTIALKTDGTLWSCGNNVFGGLGNGTNTNSSTFTQAGVANNWAHISTRAQHSLALKNDGTLWTWGYNAFGMLGDGTTIDKNTPAQINIGNTYKQVIAGLFSSSAIKPNGTLMSWGWNTHGEYGDGTTTDKLIPTQITTCTGLSTTDFSNQENVQLYPNPNNGNFKIEITGKIENAQVNVYSILGQLIYNQKINAEFTNLTIGLKQGLYLVSIENKNQTYVQKIIVE
jgi:alpha-tubulin suppressor-like RCC1 family protein